MTIATEQLPRQWWQCVAPDRARVAAAMRGTTLSAQDSNRLNMRTVEELINRRDGLEFIAAIDQAAEIARQRRRITRNGHDTRHL